MRSAKQGHVSYRHIAQQVFREVEGVHPLLAKYIRVDLDDETIAGLQPGTKSDHRSDRVSITVSIPAIGLLLYGPVPR